MAVLADEGDEAPKSLTNSKAGKQEKQSHRAGLEPRPHRPIEIVDPVDDPRGATAGFDSTPLRYGQNC